MHKFLFYNKFIIFLYMFRTLLYSTCYCHTETSEWSKITKIQFYNYEHIVVKVLVILIILVILDHSPVSVWRYQMLYNTIWPPDDEHRCSKHVEEYNKPIIQQEFVH